METFWHQLTQIHLQNGRWNGERVWPWSFCLNTVKSVITCFTLPYGEAFLPPSAKASGGPKHTPKLTVRLQNPQVQHYSPGSTSVMEPSPSPSEGTRLGSPTVMHSQYLRDNIRFESTPTWSQWPVKPKPGKYTRPIPKISIRLKKSPSAIICRPTTVWARGKTNYRSLGR